LGLVSKTYTYIAGQKIYAAQVNTNFDTLYNVINGNLDYANISDTANIAYSQLDLSAFGDIGVFIGTTTARLASSPTEGWMWYDTDLHELYAYNGSAWATVGVGAISIWEDDSWEG